MSERRSNATFVVKGKPTAKVPSWIAKGATQQAVASPDVSTLRPPRMPTDMGQVTIQGGDVGPERAAREPEGRNAPARGASPHGRRGAPDFDVTGAAAAAAMRGGLGNNSARHGDLAPPESRRSNSVFPEVGYHVDEAARAELQASLLSIANLRTQLSRQMETQLLELSALIAQRVIAKELETPRETLKALVLEGLEALTHQDQLLVRLGQAFEPHLDALQATLSLQAPHAQVVVDENLHPYACILHSELGRVDESIDQRLKVILGIAHDTLAEGHDE